MEEYQQPLLEALLRLHPLDTPPGRFDLLVLLARHHLLPSGEPAPAGCRVRPRLLLPLPVVLRLPRTPSVSPVSAPTGRGRSRGSHSCTSLLSPFDSVSTSAGGVRVSVRPRSQTSAPGGPNTGDHCFPLRLWSTDPSRTFSLLRSASPRGPLDGGCPRGQCRRRRGSRRGSR